MTVQKVRELRDKQPFQPFTIHMADGESVKVKSPEFLMITPPGRTIYVATGHGEDVEIIDLLLVTKLSTSGGNGRHGRVSRN